MMISLYRNSFGLQISNVFSMLNLAPRQKPCTYAKKAIFLWGHYLLACGGTPGISGRGETIHPSSDWEGGIERIPFSSNGEGGGEVKKVHMERYTHQLGAIKNIQ